MKKNVVADSLSGLFIT